MAVPHRQWLAAQVFSDQQTVSYRTLARALKVHVNAAKRMLYDFHAHENAKKPGSVHATYLLAGRKNIKETSASTNGQNGTQHEDEPVPSSPPPFTSSMLQSSQQNGDGEDAQVSSIRTITLVREESLDGTLPPDRDLAFTKFHSAVKSSYETITSIHIYSLSAYRLQDLQTLSDTGRHLYNSYFVKEDPLGSNAIYGVIVNKNVRRRTGRRPPPTPLDSNATINTEKTSKTNAKPAEKPSLTREPSVKKEDTSRPSSAGSTTPSSNTTKNPSLKRDTSDIFKSFAEAKNAASKATPRLTRNGTDSSVGNTSEDKDSRPPHASEDEGESEEEALFLDTKTRTSAKKRSSTEKAEREAKLRKMMDDSDKEMEDAELIDPEEAGLGKGDQEAQTDGKSEKAAIKQGTGQEDADAGGESEGVNWSDSDTERQKKARPATQAEAEPDLERDSDSDPTAPPKRRRGKRRVMKKKTIKDEEGYLVTREEAVWESFSDDEPAPAAKAKTVAKPAIASQKQSLGKGGPGKGGAAEKGKGKGGGGGNIMSFFGKK